MAKILVVGLGPGSEDDISIGVLEKLKSASKVYLRTEKHPVVDKFPGWGIEFTALDQYYQDSSTFQEVYRGIVDFLVNEAKNQGEIIYGVPGSPMVAENSVELLREKTKTEDVELEVFPALSFLDVLYPLLHIDPTDGLQIVDAMALKIERLNPNGGVLICQVYSRLIASELKLDLMEVYEDDFEIKVIRGAGLKEGEKSITIPLYQLDHVEWLDHLTTVYIPPLPKDLTKSKYPLDPLTNVMDKLLGLGGCPWDQKQDHKSLKPYLIEESYEVIEAIDEGDMNKLCDELGDLLLQVVFHGKLAEENDDFDLNQIIQGITEKMIRRHPHVFQGLKVSGTKEVLENWDMIKAEEKGNNVEKGLLDQVSKGLPALLQATKIQAKAAKVGFDWPSIEGPWSKVYEELDELKEAIHEKQQDKINEELGDLLFALINLARFLKVSPEDALFSTIRKFRKRFSFIEKQVEASGQDLKMLSLNQLDYWWDIAKKKDN